MRTIAAAVAFVALLLAADTIYSGTWESTHSGNKGDLRIQLKPDPSVTFAYNDITVKTKVVSVSQDGANFAIAYDYDVEGYTLRSSLKGQVKEDTIQGTYAAAPPGGGTPVDEGTFRVTLVK